MFQILMCNLACLTIAALYYGYRDVYLVRRRRMGLHLRVSHLLWAAASR